MLMFMIFSFYSIVRKPSLQSLGLGANEILTTGESILSIQMFGILIGGIVWGIMGDKKGRKSVLFGSILLYSLASIANGMVTNATSMASSVSLPDWDWQVN